MAQAPICSLNPVPPPIAGILWEILQLTSVKYQTDIYIYIHMCSRVLSLSAHSAYLSICLHLPLKIIALQCTLFHEVIDILSSESSHCSHHEHGLLSTLLNLAKPDKFLFPLCDFECCDVFHLLLLPPGDISSALHSPHGIHFHLAGLVYISD